MDLVSLNKQAYNKIAGQFSLSRLEVWPEFNEFTAYLKSGQRILDWGCGNGRLLRMIKDKNIEYYGVDQSSKILKYARKINKNLIKPGQAHFYCSANRSKNFPANFFDLAFMVASFFHLPDEKSRLALLNKTFKELKSGGFVIMTLWNLGSEWAKKKKPTWEKVGAEDYLIPWKDQNGKVLALRYYHHFSQTEISWLLTKAKFVIKDLHYFNQTAWTDEKGGRNLIVVAQKP